MENFYRYMNGENSMNIFKKIILKILDKQAQILSVQMYEKFNTLPKIPEKIENSNDLLGKTTALLEEIKHLCVINEKIDNTNNLLAQTTMLLQEIKHNNPRDSKYLFYKVCERAQEQTIDYIYSHMSNAICITDYEQFLRYCYAKSKKSGDIFEFGVFSGYTINFLAEMASDTEVYGFDSFEGLPEDWKGYHYFDFNRQGVMPEVRPNVKLVQGWFSESIPNFLSSYEKKDFKLLHIDCDLYSSTKDIFENLKHYIIKDLVIVFDEYFNYPNFQQHEFKAFQEFIVNNAMAYEYIAYCGERVAVKII